MNKRIQTYFEVTEPVIEYYKQKGVLRAVDSSQGTDATFSEIERILEGDDVNN
jgi:adenylate kinase family enzyme